MADMKFQVGDPVFYYTMIDRIPGIIQSAGQDENGHWVYVIRISDTMYADNVYEHKIAIRTILDDPKYNRGDKVRFIAGNNEEYEGYIEIVDRYGTFEQAEEPSYDILVKGTPGCLHKHIRESGVIGLSE